MEWGDDYLNWTVIPGIDFYKLFAVQVPKSYLWTPDIIVWNSADDNRLLKIANDSILTVNYTGQVSGQISTLLHTECEMRVIEYHFIELYLSQSLLSCARMYSLSNSMSDKSTIRNKVNLCLLQN